MKKTTVLLIGVIVSIFSGCTEFPAKFSRIEERVRIIGYQSVPADPVPGDTVRFNIYFAGKHPEPGDISWEVSYDMGTSLYGADTIGPSKPIERFNTTSETAPPGFSEKTKRISFSTVIPEDVIPENDFFLVRLQKYKDFIPPEYSDLLSGDSLRILVDYLNQIAGRSPSWAPVLPENEDSLSESDPVFRIYSLLKPNLPVLLQIFGTKARYYSYYDGIDAGKCSFAFYDKAIRYNSAFADLPDLNVYRNRNPVIERAGIYKVEAENIVSFDPEVSSHQYEFYPLIKGDSEEAPQAIPVDKECSYFLSNKIQMDVIDSVISIDEAASNRPSSETERYDRLWFLKLEDEEIKGVDKGDYPVVGYGDPNTPITPPEDKSIENFTVWLNIRDRYTPESNRPQGSDVAEFKGRFKH